MKKYVVQARVIVPVWGTLTIEAENIDDAKAKAMEAAAGAQDDEDAVWESKLWQDGDWCSDIRWEAAEGLTIEDVMEDEWQTTSEPVEAITSK